MNAQASLTIKHVNETGNISYLAAISVEVCFPPAPRECFLRIEVADGEPRRECYGGRAYLMNAAGKTIEVFNLSQVAPVTNEAA